MYAASRQAPPSPLMLRLAALALALTGACSAATLPFPGIARSSGQKFTLNGAPFNFAGTNAYWWSFLTNLSDTSIAMQQTKMAGLKVARTWGFNELNTTFIPTGLPQYNNLTDDIFYQSWTNGKPTINFGANGMQHFDKVVAMAEQHGIKLIVALTNNWADYGGMDVYTVNMGGQFHDDFYTNANIKAAFKTYVRAMVSRHWLSPAIFAWELANEPRCGADGNRNLPASASCTPATLTAWAEEMSAFIKSIDPFHMVTTGAEGFFNEVGNADWAYNGANGVDSAALLALPHIDFGTLHLYPDWWTKDPLVWAPAYISAHAALQKAVGKPVVLEEYGWMDAAARLSNLGIVSNVTRDQAIGLWQETALQGKLPGDLYWQLGVSGLSFGNSTDDGFTIYFSAVNESKPLIFDHVRQVDALNFQH